MQDEGGKHKQAITIIPSQADIYILYNNILTRQSHSINKKLICIVKVAVSAERCTGKHTHTHTHMLASN